MCQSASRTTKFAAAQTTPLDSGEENNCAALFHLAAFSEGQNLISIKLNGQTTKALLDTGSDKTFISQKFCHINNINYKTKKGSVLLADESHLNILGHFLAEIEWKNHLYAVKVSVVKNLLAPVVLGLDVLSQHQSITVKFQGLKPPISVCMTLKEMSCQPCRLAQGVDFSLIKPVVTTSRPNQRDSDFIKTEIKRMLSENIIQTSRSSWRAQCFVVHRNGKQRLVVDYSNTINRFTRLDAYPTPNIQDLLNKIGRHKYFSKIYLREEYHQVPLMNDDYQLTAFEALGQLFEFRRLPFGCTNAVPIFQRTMDSFIKQNDLENTYAYLDDILICGETQHEHDKNLIKFKKAAAHRGLQFNESKCMFNTKSIVFLGHVIEGGSFRPDPSRYNHYWIFLNQKILCN